MRSKPTCRRRVSRSQTFLFHIGRYLEHGCAALPAELERLQEPNPERSSLLDGADGEAGDEAVEEEIVEEGDRQAGNEASGHERAPIIDVAANQENGDAGANHLI